ncbi:hypothetical protein [Streptomyces sp. NPDC006285]|uniref:hypothetical protein n=1 Tax=Streptomyces sp. NPDC006285 TaxID=3364742 RepID=UPI0036CD7889
MVRPQPVPSIVRDQLRAGPSGGHRKLNTVARRFQLATGLTQELDWLRGCSVPQIARSGEAPACSLC